MKPSVQIELQSNTNSLVSVGIPTFNRPDLLEARLRSVLSQTHQNIEVIISDNASSDPRVEQIGRRFARLDTRVRYVRQDKNIGASRNFAFVLGASIGTYFIWAADDDDWDRQLLEFCLSNIGDASLLVPRIRLRYLSDGREEQVQLPKLSVKNGVERNALEFLANAQPSMVYGLYDRRRLIEAFDWRYQFDLWDVSLLFRLVLDGGVEVALGAPEYCAGIPGESYQIKPFGANNTMSYRAFVFEMVKSALNVPKISIWCRIRLAWATLKMCLDLIVHLVKVYPEAASIWHRLLRVTRLKHYAAALFRRFFPR